MIAENESADIFSDASTDELPDRELYIRWLELATFLPVRRYSYLPSQYDKEVVDLAKNLTTLRQQKVCQYNITRIEAKLGFYFSNEMLIRSRRSIRYCRNTCEKLWKLAFL